MMLPRRSRASAPASAYAECQETYKTIEELARQQGVTPEALTEKLLRERLTERLALARQNAEWEADLDEALVRAASGANPTYDSADALFNALDRAAEHGDD
jgi:hypothetical protein